MRATNSPGVGSAADDGAVRGSGMIDSGMLLIQPPYGIADELAGSLVPALERTLRQEGRVFAL